MPHSTNKELILGIMAGTAGISLIFLWYHKVRKPRTTVTFPKFFSLGKKFGSLTLQDESHSEQGPSTLFQRRQLQILEKLNELLTNMEELKEEIRCLKEAIPKLEEYIQDELGGKVTVHKMSPQHRARKKKVTTVQSSATSNSSEEAESEGGCWKEDQSFQPNCPEDQVPPQAVHHGASNILQLEGAPDYIAYKTNRKLSSSSSASGRLYLSKGRHSLLTRFRRKKRQQSRVNFDSQEDLTLNATRSSNLFSAVRAQCFSPSKLSVVSCYRNNIVYDTPQSSLNPSHSNKLQGLSKRSTNIHAQKHISFSDTKHGRKYFPNLETKAVSSSHWTVERASYPPSLTTSLFSLSTVISSSNQVSVADSSGYGQLSKDSDDALHHRSQSRSRDPSPAGVEHLSRNVTSASLLHARFPSPYKNINNLTVEVTSGPFEEENFPASPFDEAIPSPIELNEIRSLGFSFSLRRAA